MRRLFAFAFILLSFTPVNAQTFPAKPVKFVVGFGAGGPTDVIARFIAQDMTESMGQPVLVENKPGANAIIATEYVAQAPADGYTLLFSSLSLLVNHALVGSKVNYDPFKDFAPICNAANLPMVIVTGAETPIHSVAELIAAAKARPGELSYGTSGHAGSSHLAGAMLENATGTKMINVPFKGNGPALAEVMAGRVTFMFYPSEGIAQQVAAKRLKVLAVGTPAPLAEFPGSPTFAQSGLDGLEATAPWVGLLAPAGTPPAIVTRMSQEVAQAVRSPEVAQRFAQLDIEPVGSTPAEYAARIRAADEKYAQAVKVSGARLDN